jgi:hypothetical protein
MKATKELDILKRLGGRCDMTTGVDAIFVHGAETDIEQCWHPPGHPEFSLPKMLAKELPYVCSWSLGYTSTLYRRKGFTLRLEKQAAQTIRELANRYIGRRKVVFVAHSVGGLLVKHVLRFASESKDEEWKRIVEKTKGVVFLSTPHFGFRMVKLARWLSYLPTINDALLADLLDLEGLGQLNKDFLDIVQERTIEVEAYYEAKRSSGLLWLATKVSEKSATLGEPVAKPAPLIADHEGVCKPVGPDDHVYRSVRKFVRKCFAGPVNDIFISYAHEDEGAADTLRAHFKPLARQFSTHIWTDRLIETGDAWQTEIMKHMESSRVAVLLLSKAFLESEFITGTELPLLWRKADTEGIRIICVPLERVETEQLSFKYSVPEGGEKRFDLNDVQWASSRDQPVDRMSPDKIDEFFANLARDTMKFSSSS